MRPANDLDTGTSDECTECLGEEGPGNGCGECGGSVDCVECGRDLDPTSEPCDC